MVIPEWLAVLIRNVLPRLLRAGNPARLPLLLHLERDPREEDTRKASPALYPPPDDWNRSVSRMPPAVGSYPRLIPFGEAGGR